MKVDMNQVEAPTNLVFPQEASPETKLSASMNRPEADPSTSFTADSPYFKTYVENEIEDLETLKAVLAEISQKAGIFGANARLMIQSMRELAQACRLKRDMEKLDGESEIERKHRELGYLKERRSCLGEDMVAVFKNLGQMFDELAESHDYMIRHIDESLHQSMDKLYTSDNFRVAELAATSKNLTDSAEKALDRYLLESKEEDCKEATQWLARKWSRGSHLSSHSMHVRTRLETSGHKRESKQPLSVSHHAVEKRRLGSSSHQKKEPSGLRSSGHHMMDRRGHSPSSQNRERRHSKNHEKMGSARVKCEELRLILASAEICRFQLFRQLKSIKESRDSELGSSALMVVKHVRTFYQQCSHRVPELNSRLSDIERVNRKCRRREVMPEFSWGDREEHLHEAIQSMEKAKSYATNLVASSDLVDHIQENQSLASTEQVTGLWKLPTLMAEASRYQREPLPGVILEGWLYGEISGKTAPKRQRRWYLLDSENLFYFKPKMEIQNGKSHHTLTRVKVCNMGACALRQFSSSEPRFVFELISPKCPSIMLQAQGPDDYNRWVEGIQRAIDKSLGVPSMRDNVSSSEMMEQRRGSLIEDTIDEDDYDNRYEMLDCLDAGAAHRVCPDCGMERPMSEQLCGICARRGQNNHVQRWSARGRQFLQKLPLKGQHSQSPPEQESFGDGSSHSFYSESDVADTFSDEEGKKTNCRIPRPEQLGKNRRQRSLSENLDQLRTPGAPMSRPQPLSADVRRSSSNRKDSLDQLRKSSHHVVSLM